MARSVKKGPFVDAHLMKKVDTALTTKDKRRTAQFEHTVLVTASGAEILTLPSPS